MANKNFLYYIIILCVCFFAFFVNNKIIPADIMEARNLATAQEMVRTGNYLIPTMNGELRLEKPPLPTWIAAGVEHICPGNLSVQRGVAGISATLLILFLFLLVAKLTRDNKIALLSALVAATSYSVIMIGRTVTWDIYCHSFMLGAIYFLVCAIEEKGRQWGHFLLAGIFMGLSFLSKGPVSFYALLVPFIIAYAITLRPSMKGKIIPLFIMILVCLIISFWWPAYIAVFHSEIGLSVAQKESTNWLNYNTRPLWYYWKFPAEAGIWIFFWITALIYCFWKKKVEQRKVFYFSVLWTIAGFILLSIIPEKKTRYLFPLLIPGAINIGFYIWHSAKDAMSKTEKAIFRINSILVAIIAFALPFALYFVLTKNGQTLPYFIFITITILCWGIVIYIFRALFNKKGIGVLKTFSAIVLLMITFEALCIPAVAKIFINNKRYSVWYLRDNPKVQGLPFFYNDKDFLRIELVYEANQSIRPISLDNDAEIYSNLPFVLVSNEPAKDLLKDKNVLIEYIDTFDNNWRHSTDKSYDKQMIKEVAIIRAKN